MIIDNTSLDLPAIPGGIAKKLQLRLRDKTKQNKIKFPLNVAHELKHTKKCSTFNLEL